MFSALVNQLIVIFLYVLIGFVANKTKVIDERLQNGLSSVVMTIVIPCSIIASANKPMEPSNLSAIVIIFLGGALYHIFAMISLEGITKFLPISKKQKAVFSCLSIFPNVGFIGYPIMSVFLPENGIFFASFYLVTFYLGFFTYGVFKLSDIKKFSLKTVFTNINILACILMVVLYVLQIKFPTPVQSAIQNIGSMSSSLSMIVVGSMLANNRIRGLFSNLLLYLSSLLRLIIFPTIMFVILLFLPFPHEVEIVLLVMTGLPTATLTALAAETYNCEPEFASNGAIQSVLLFAITVFYLTFLVTFL